MLNHEITIEEKEAALFKLLSHPIISESASLRNYLEFVTHEVIKGRAERLGEYEIGTRVFHKPPEFDPRLDPVVRAHARRLRTRLADYYRHDGRKDPVRVDVSRGTYLPHFVRNRPRFSVSLPVVLWTAILVVLISIGWAGWKVWHFYRGGPGVTPEQKLETTLLLLPFTTSHKTILLVFPSDYYLRDNDGNLLQVRPEVRGDLPRRLMMNPGELLATPSLRRTAPLYVEGGYSGSGEAACAALISNYLGWREKTVEVRTTEFGKAIPYGGSNVIFLGAPPPALLPRKSSAALEFRLTEQTQPDGSSLPVIENTNVAQGEKALYAALRDSASRAFEAVYSLVSLMPGDEPETSFLMIASQSPAGVRSGCEYLVNGRADGDLPPGWRSSGLAPRIIEILLRTPVHEMTPARAEYVTHHYRE